MPRHGSKRGVALTFLDAGNLPERLCVIVPVYNERETLPALLEKLCATRFTHPDGSPLPAMVVVVDDGSRDGTAKWLSEQPLPIRVLTLPENGGKGTAIRTALACLGDEVTIVAIQDGDLEYDPGALPGLAHALLEAPPQIMAVYGSRFLLPENLARFRPLYRRANRLLSGLTNALFGTHLSDMETGHKLIRHPALQALNLQACRFEIEPELTARLARRFGPRCILEKPTPYAGRTRASGKKIGWADGFEAVWTLLWQALTYWPKRKTSRQHR